MQVNNIVVLTKEDLIELVRQTSSAVVTELHDMLAPLRIREIMTKEQLAEYLDYSVGTINNYMRRPTRPLPFEMGQNGDHPRFRKTDVDRWMKNDKQTSGGANGTSH